MSKLTSIFSLFTAMTVSSGIATAQSFNVDLGAQQGVPANTFGAYPQRVGFWNLWSPAGLSSLYSAGTTISLQPITGPPNTPPVTATTSTLAQAFPMAVAPVTGTVDVVSLYGDYLQGGPNREVLIDNLQPGDYLTFLYSWRNGGGAFWDISTPTSGSQFTQMSYGATWPGPYRTPAAFPFGHSMATAQVTVGAGDTLRFLALCEEGGGNGEGEIDPVQPGCALNGFQLVPLLGTAYCAQPINSQGLEMRMVAWGTSTNGNPSISAGDLTLALGVVQSPLPIVGTAVLPMVSTDMNAGVPLGCPRFGSLCIGTSMGQNISTLTAGIAQPDGTFSTQVDVGAGTFPINVFAGQTLYFQAYYRDFPDPIQCPANNFLARLSNALELTFAP